MWCIPQLNDEYIQRMEDVLNLYEKPYNPMEPVVCFDEKPVQLLGEIKPVIKAKKPGQIQKRDFEYSRKGVVNIFSCVEPKAGKHLTDVMITKKGSDFAIFAKKIIKAYPNVKTIHLVMDNYNTHFLKSLIAYYGEREANEIWSHFTVHYTPKHASWLNQAEIENNICGTQCLGKRRFESYEEVKKEVLAWKKAANKKCLMIKWEFTSKKAREKFKYKI